MANRWAKFLSLGDWFKWVAFDHVPEGNTIGWRYLSQARRGNSVCVTSGLPDWRPCR